MWPAGAFLLLYPFVTLVPGYPPADDERVNVARALRLVVEGAALVWAAGRADLPGRLRLALRLNGGTSLLAAADDLAMALGPMPVPAWREALGHHVYVLSYVLVLASLLVYPRRPMRRDQRWTLAADLLVTVASLGAISWLVLAAPAVRTGAAAPLAAATASLSQIAMMVGLNVLVVLGRRLPSRRAFGWFVAGQALYLPVVYLEVVQSSEPALVLASDAFYFAGVVPTLVAAVLIRADPLAPERHEPPGRLLELNPVALASPVLLGLVLLHAIVRGPDERVLPLAATLLAVTGVLVGRVVAASVQNARLRRREREAERRLQAAKMETVSRLAGGIAHEFNNALAAVIGTATLGAEEAGRGSAARADFEAIREAAERAAALTRRLLLVGSRRPDRRRPLDLAAEVERLAPALREAAGEQVRLHLVAEPAPRANADPAGVEAVLLHLARNAGGAMPGGGTLRIAVRGEALAEPLASPYLSAPPGRYVAVEVEDSGAGIPAEHLPRIFEPFFTTRPIFDAKGLGLAEVHGIVAAHAGGLSVRSEPGRGTSFTVLLPAAQG
jgi:signal transduction histidine kinase